MKRSLTAGILLSFFTFLFLLFFISADSFSAGENPGDMEVVFLNVGQGDSTLISTPGDKHILIDGGVGRGYGVTDQGKKTILPYLRKKGITKLDTIIAPHPDFDHIGGLVSVVKNRGLEIEEFLDPGLAHPSQGYLSLLEAIRARPEIIYRQPRAGEKLNWGDELTVEVVSPPYLLYDNNNCSIVVKLTYGDISFLFTGDAAEMAEQLMEKNYGYRLRSTILKAGHHGSKHSSGREFLNYVSPRVVIFSAGENNKYGHPNQEVLERVKRKGAKIFRTDRQGTITIITDGQSYRVVTEKEG